MGESSFDRWANVLVDYSTEVATGDQVAISGGVAAEPLLRAIYRAVLRKGGLPVLLPSFSEAQADLSISRRTSSWPISLRWNGGCARRHPSPLTSAPAPTRERSPRSIHPGNRSGAEHGPSYDSGLRACRARRTPLVVHHLPDPAHAQDADMATDEFAAFLEVACMLDRPDPIAAWRELSARQARMIDWLQERSEIHITAPGTDLRLSVGGRSWVNSDGKRNFPSGEVFTGPVEDSVEGHIHFTYPVVTQGREVSGIRLRFDAGLVVDASADKNEPFLVETLDTDPERAAGRVRVRDERRDLAMDKEHPARREDGWHGAHGAWLGCPKPAARTPPPFTGT